MEKIGSFIKVEQKEQKQTRLQRWQDQALDAVKQLVDGNQNRSSIFGLYKKDPRTAEIALADALELNKPYSKYFFKVYSELKKKYVEEN